MGKLNISKNLFLEKAELDQFQNFLIENPTSALFRSVTQQFGIVSSPDNSGDDFLIEEGSTNGTIKTVLENETSTAITSENLLITAVPFDNYVLPDDNQIYWIKIRHKFVNYEEGVVNINSDGTVSGTNTSFLSFLRGQSTKVPTSIRFVKLGSDFNTNLKLPTETDSTNNPGIYEIIDVPSESSMTLSGVLTNENNLKYVVVGSYTLGTNLSSEQQEGIYSKDGVEYELVLAADENTPPAGLDSGKEFYIAAVRRNGSTVDVWDRRTNYYWTVDFGVTLNNKANTDASNVDEATYSANWSDLVNYNNKDFLDFDVALGNITLSDNISILRVTSTGLFGGNYSNITLPTASSVGNAGKVIYIVVSQPTAFTEDGFNIKDGATTILSRDLDRGLYETIIIKSNGANWYVVKENPRQGSTEMLGLWKKASDNELLLGVGDNVITPSILGLRTATTTRTGLVEKATSTERDAGTGDKYIDSSLLKGAIGLAQEITESIPLSGGGVDDVHVKIMYRSPKTVTATFSIPSPVNVTTLSSVINSALRPHSSSLAINYGSFLGTSNVIQAAIDGSNGEVIVINNFGRRVELSIDYAITI